MPTYPWTSLTQHHTGPGLTFPAVALPPEHPVLGPVIRYATITDAPFIESLRRRNGRELGFMPLHAILNKIARKQAIILEFKQWPAGFCIFSHAPDATRITMLCVDRSIRRKGHGTQTLIAAAAALNPHKAKLVTLRCAIDIEATLFWRALGFAPLQIEHNSQHPSRDLIRWISLPDFTTLARLKADPEEVFWAYKSLETSALLRYGLREEKPLSPHLARRLASLPLNSKKCDALYSSLLSNSGDSPALKPATATYALQPNLATPLQPSTSGSTRQQPANLAPSPTNTYS
jgi:GNAT superfamily N-acetyltransferase